MTKTDEPQKCWICKDGPAVTNEHKIKNSNYLLVFGKVTQKDPLYYNDNQRRKNYKIGGTKNVLLTWQDTLCSECNNKRTQPHDIAWDSLLEAIYNRKPAIQKGTIICADRIFDYKTRQKMLNVHLYFVKLFGCLIINEKIPIDIKDFSSSIMNSKAHPCVFLKFGVFSSGRSPIVGGSDVDIIESNGSCIFAGWYHRINNLTVHVMFAPHSEEWNVLRDSWHPSHSTNNLKICDFNELSQK